ncbi:adenosine deaminase family protein [Microbacterium sp. cx-59]|uniref:adenosine deaminase family protein n=1 Tax=Microbacterium sp. cx-59 TaxID=2891207 RepID=UPI001E609431|nr:adenosine deaminase family protein [Microbacterium sp. cx-59]MCC4908915.1 adenosine deaminase family protein [Microbacterium sp. cx-59]
MSHPTTWIDANDPLVTLPKIALHDHLDGSLRPETLIELATDAGVPLPRTEPGELQYWLRNFGTVEPGRDWEDLFGLSTSVMQTSAQLRRVAREYVHTLAADGVVYAETRWAPEKHRAAGLRMDEAVAAVWDGLELGMRDVRALGHSVEVRQILSIMRTGAVGDEVVDAAAAGADLGVVGIDLAGHEEGHPARDHADAFQRAAARGIRRTVHAGEADGAASIADAIATCAAERIGHGARLVEDIAVAGEARDVHTAVAAWRADGADPASLALGPVATRIRDAGIVLEVCPTSNSEGSVVASLAQHPVALLAAAGIRVSLHPDNRMLSETSVTGEMRAVVREFGWTHAQLRASTVNALEAAFGPRELLERIRVETLIPGWD